MKLRKEWSVIPLAFFNAHSSMGSHAALMCFQLINQALQSGIRPPRVAMKRPPIQCKEASLDHKIKFLRQAVRFFLLFRVLTAQK